MACGTPVIAYRSGSVPEVVDDSVTGFVVSGEAEAIQAIGRLSELDRRQVRRQFEKRFATRRMAQEYLRHYEALSQPNAGETRAGIMRTSSSVPDRPFCPVAIPSQPTRSCLLCVSKLMLSNLPDASLRARSTGSQLSTTRQGSNPRGRLSNFGLRIPITLTQKLSGLCLTRIWLGKPAERPC